MGEESITGILGPFLLLCRGAAPALAPIPGKPVVACWAFPLGSLGDLLPRGDERDPPQTLFGGSDGAADALPLHYADRAAPWTVQLLKI